jgi:hypothetical protein
MTKQAFMLRWGMIALHAVVIMGLVWMLLLFAADRWEIPLGSAKRHEARVLSRGINFDLGYADPRVTAKVRLRNGEEGEVMMPTDDIFAIGQEVPVLRQSLLLRPPRIEFLDLRDQP